MGRFFGVGSNGFRGEDSPAKIYFGWGLTGAPFLAISPPVLVARAAAFPWTSGRSGGLLGSTVRTQGPGSRAGVKRAGDPNGSIRPRRNPSATKKGRPRCSGRWPATSRTFTGLSPTSPLTATLTATRCAVARGGRRPPTPSPRWLTRLKDSRTVGMVPGRIGFVVVDVDITDPKDPNVIALMADIRETFDKESVFAIRSGSGGAHVYIAASTEYAMKVKGEKHYTNGVSHGGVSGRGRLCRGVAPHREDGVERQGAGPPADAGQADHGVHGAAQGSICNRSANKRSSV